ncbi:MAG: methyltransferase family protein [Candidatus Ratteibacteria bacterium]
MKKIRNFNVFLGVLWEWILLPILFYFFLPKDEKYFFLFPESIFIRILVFLIYLLYGLYFTFHSCWALHRIGKGTILPNDPPEKLVKDSVYSFCRNPMYLGYSFLFFAFGFLMRNISFLFLSVGVVIFIYIYSKLIEEKVLLKRFGNEYLVYKSQTPFIISFVRHKNIFYTFSTFLFLVILSLVIRSALVLIIVDLLSKKK